MLSVVLVDDERSTLDGISSAFARYHLPYRIAGMFQQAQKALEYLAEPGVAETVDAVITDVRMPGMDGIALTQILSQRYPHLHIIALSGYADYDMVRRCMKYGAVDYLLKPYSLAALRQLLDAAAVEKEKREKTRRISKIEEALRSGPESNEMLETLFLSQERMSAAVLAEPTGRLTSNSREVTEFLSEYEDAGNLALSGDGLVYILTGRFSHESEFLEALGTLIQRMQKRYPKLIALSAFESTLPPEKRRAQLGKCQQAALHALFNEKSGVMSASAWHAYLEVPQEHIERQSLQPDLLAALLLKGEQATVERQIDKMVLRLMDPTLVFHPSAVKRQTLRLLLALEQLVLQESEDAPRRWQEDCIRQIEDIRTRSELSDYLRSFAASFRQIAPPQQQIPRYIHEAMDHIRRNYMKDIRLSDVAEYVYLNEWYLSTQFKKYCGMTFKEYLNQVRMEAAKELLKQPDLKLWQISEMIGIRDATYFTSVFRKHASMSPREWRQLFARTNNHTNGAPNRGKQE